MQNEKIYIKHMKDIAFCAIIKNEARYLDEWLAYHYLIGVEHFYITDDNSTDNIKSVLQKWIKAGLVTYMKMDELLKTNPARKTLCERAYCDILKNKWKNLGFFGVDEFLVTPNGNITAQRPDASYSGAIDEVIKELKKMFPDDFVEEGLSYLYGDELIACAKTLTVSNLKSPQYIVLLTSCGKRLQTTAPIAIASMLNGHFLPDRIILWIPDGEKEIAEQNAQLQILRNKGLEIKLISAFQEFTNDYIITADDNLLYPNSWFEQIMENHKKYPNKIICHSARGIRVDGEYNLLPFEDWDQYDGQEEPERIFPVSKAGVLYPPNNLPKLVLKADDACLWAMALINNAENPFIVIPNGYSNTIALQSVEDANDEQLNAVINEYPQIREVLNKIKPFSLVYIEAISKAIFAFESPQMKYPEQKGLISVIVPVYNNEIYLRECLDSLLSQTFTNWEAIIVNDGSTDNTGKIIDEYAKKDSRFIAIHKPNGGTLQARKTGLENSRGEYIANLDSDDTYSVQFLEKMFEKIMETNSDFVWCNTKLSNYYQWNENKATNVNYAFSNSEGFKCFLWNKLVKRNIYERIEFAKCHVIGGEDPIQMMQIAYYSKYAVQVPENLYNYREESTISTSKTDSIMNEEQKKVKYITEIIIKVKILQNLFGNLFQFFPGFDFQFKKALRHYNQLDRETRVKYGIEGMVIV
jgi:glycosyltransferase involved in cell wall biosynthesis